MSDWSAPKQDIHGDWIMRREEEGLVANLHDGGLLCRDADIHAIPADAALRLLAAEASDRLGLEWNSAERPGCDAPMRWMITQLPSGVEIDWLSCEGKPPELSIWTTEGTERITADEWPAMGHGKFLLEAAIKETA